MKENDYTIDNLIARVLTQEATPEDHRLMDEWLKLSDDNRRYFEHMRTIFNEVAKLPEEPFDTDRAWQAVRTRIDATGHETAGRGKVVALPVWWAAAAVLLLSVPGFFLLRSLMAPQETHYAIVAERTVHQETLADGTMVWMKDQTALRHSVDQRTNTHSVVLEGEAFFEISPDPRKTFVVHAGETFIRDIGTAFNVVAHPDSAAVEVSVLEGEVMFYTRTNPGVSVQAGQKGSYDRLSDTFTITQPQQNEYAYKTKTFLFNNQTLRQVVRSLNEAYDRKIRISPELGRCRLTVSFENETIEEVSAVIAETLNLTVYHEGDTIILKGEGCPQ